MRDPENGPTISQSLIRGLALIEAVGEIPGSVSELARRLELDKAVVSRLAAAAEAEGWITRHGTQLQLGPRAGVLGRSSQARRFEVHATTMAHVVAGVTGLDSHVNQLAGRNSLLVAHFAGRTVLFTGDVTQHPFPLSATSVGICLLAQVPSEQVQEYLPRPLPRFTPRTVGEDEVLARVADVRAGAVASETGEFIEGMSCLALPWPQAITPVPAAIACIGLTDQVEASRSVIEAVLRAAVRPGATPQTVIAAAAAAAAPAPGETSSDRGSTPAR